jgi:hypothetical protein
MWVGPRLLEDEPTFKTAHNNHQFCACVVSPDDGQVMSETCRVIEHQLSVSESEVCIKLVVLIT